MSKGRRAPDINIDEEEYPNDIDEMPIPGSRFKADMMIRFEMALLQAHRTDCQEAGADKDVEAMKARGQIERRWINAITQFKRCINIFFSLEK